MLVERRRTEERRTPFFGVAKAQVASLRAQMETVEPDVPQQYSDVFDPSYLAAIACAARRQH